MFGNEDNEEQQDGRCLDQKANVIIVLINFFFARS